MITKRPSSRSMPASTHPSSTLAALLTRAAGNGGGRRIVGTFRATGSVRTGYTADGAVAYAATTELPAASATVTFEASELLDNESEAPRSFVVGRISFACHQHPALESLELHLSVTSGDRQRTMSPLTRLLMLFQTGPATTAPWPTFVHRPWQGWPQFVEPQGTLGEEATEESSGWRTGFLRLPLMFGPDDPPRFACLGLRWYEWPEQHVDRAGQGGYR